MKNLLKFDENLDFLWKVGDLFLEARAAWGRPLAFLSCDWRFQKVVSYSSKQELQGVVLWPSFLVVSGAIPSSCFSLVEILKEGPILERFWGRFKVLKAEKGTASWNTSAESAESAARSHEPPDKPHLPRTHFTDDVSIHKANSLKWIICGRNVLETINNATKIYL